MEKAKKIRFFNGFCDAVSLSLRRVPQKYQINRASIYKNFNGISQLVTGGRAKVKRGLMYLLNDFSTK